MTDLEHAKELLDRGVCCEVGGITLQQLRDILGTNQNPGCGGDRKMTRKQWAALSDCVAALDRFLSKRAELREMPAVGPLMETEKEGHCRDCQSFKINSVPPGFTESSGWCCYQGAAMPVNGGCPGFEPRG